MGCIISLCTPLLFVFMFSLFFIPMHFQQSAGGGVEQYLGAGVFLLYREMF